MSDSVPRWYVFTLVYSFPSNIEEALGEEAMLGRWGFSHRSVGPFLGIVMSLNKKVPNLICSYGGGPLEPRWG